MNSALKIALKMCTLEAGHFGEGNQMYLKGKIDGFLSEWKADPGRKPLIIRGSRQVGKTESVLHFAADHYESVIEINFVRDE